MRKRNQYGQNGRLKLNHGKCCEPYQINCHLAENNEAAIYLSGVHDSKGVEKPTIILLYYDMCRIGL